jgi:hypothetical protein
MTHVMNICKSLYTTAVILNFHHRANEVLTLLGYCMALAGSLRVSGFTLGP